MDIPAAFQKQVTSKSSDPRANLGFSRGGGGGGGGFRGWWWIFKKLSKLYRPFCRLTKLIAARCPSKLVYIGAKGDLRKNLESVQSKMDIVKKFKEGNLRVVRGSNP